jgi:hypothetical protein
MEPRGDRTLTRRLALAGSLALLGMLVAVPGAMAQSATQQYVPDLGTQGSTATGGTGNNGNTGNSNAGNGTQGTAAAGEVASGGKTLPFTGYPLTTLIWIVLMFLIVGLGLRLFVPVLDRRANRA